MRATIKTIYIVSLVFIVLLAISGCSETNLAKVNKDYQSPRISIDNLQKAIEMHKPQVLIIDNQEILYVPTSRVSGSSYSVDCKFYTYEDGKLKRIDLPN